MARNREVGTLWIGGHLSWMEQLCLKSFVDQGQKITLFSYEEIPNVPKGVIQRDGREIIDTDDFIKYEQKNSFALFADWFRLHMIHKCPSMIWIDTDVYCHQPMTYDSDYVLGFELPGEQRINNAVLGLPHDSEMLRQMLHFTEDRYSIAPFLSAHRQKEMRQLAMEGTPMHISQQQWGVWGPMMVTYYAHSLGLKRHIMPLDAFYPITFRERTTFLEQTEVVEAKLTEKTTALHLWASNKKELGNRHNGLPPVGSYLEKLLKLHEIEPSLAPLTSRGNNLFDAALLNDLQVSDVNSVLDVSGAARGLCLALHHKFDCDVLLADLNSEGKFEDGPQPWLKDYSQFLKTHGVDKSKIKILKKPKDLKPVDVVCNLSGFGDSYKIGPLSRIMEKCFHSDTQLLTDIRKGSGAYPFFREYGTTQQLSQHKIKGSNVDRILFTPVVRENVEDSGGWDKIAENLAGKDGWYRPGTNGHSFLFQPRSTDTLVVTFDNLDITMTKRDDRRPWGYSFIEKQGWSMLGVLAGGWTWYREPWVYDQFDDLKKSGFFKQFKRVVFYGASMGGYAACAFSPAAPGCDVVAISPQSTLDKTIVPWETRYKVAWDRDYKGKYGDAAKVSKAANRVSILFDPYEPLDAQHAARFENKNVQFLRTPLLGHRLGSSLSQMGILSPIILGALNGTLTSSEFYTLLRARKEFPRYQRELFNKAVDKGHVALAKSLGEHILSKNANRAVRLGLQALP